VSTLKLPIRDRAETLTIKTISELSGLLDHPQERRSCQELLMWFYGIGLKAGKQIKIGTIERALEEATLPERQVLSAWFGGQPIPQSEPPRTRLASETEEWAIERGGAIVPKDRPAVAAAREQERSLAAQRDAALQERAPEAQAMRENEAAIAEEHRRLAPPGVPT
jgi:hypothetical protein